MANSSNLNPSAESRKELARRDGADAARCFQCATCTSVGQLATSDAMFPYSKFAHIYYRTLAMIHERMIKKENAA